MAVAFTALTKGRVAAPAADVLMVGSPNVGKTSLFNALTGLRARTANFPGTTTELRHAYVTLAGRRVRLVDLPGLYSLQGCTSDEKLAADAVLARAPGLPRPSAIVLLLDATNLGRSLFLAGEILGAGVPTVVALNMSDLADRRGLQIDVEKLSQELGCPVVPTAAPRGRGTSLLLEKLEELLSTGSCSSPRTDWASLEGCEDCPYQKRYAWAVRISTRCFHGPGGAGQVDSERLDRWLTHPIAGLVAFLAVMFTMFYLIFSLAEVPMTLIESAFGSLGRWLGTVLPDGQLNSLVVDGVVDGVGSLLVFLPQICILFFLITLLEDTGYLARAAFVMDRLMRRFGLPGKAFLPFLSAHACAIPGIMAARVIDDKRDRLATILVLPLVTCAAGLPVYALIAAFLFPQAPVKAA